MQDDEKGKHANARYMLPSGTPSPQAGLLTRWRVIPIVPVECLRPDTAFEAVPRWLHDLLVVVRDIFRCLGYVE